MFAGSLSAQKRGPGVPCDLNLGHLCLHVWDAWPLIFSEWWQYILERDAPSCSPSCCLQDVDELMQCMYLYFLYMICRVSSCAAEPHRPNVNLSHVGSRHLTSFSQLSRKNLPAPLHTLNTWFECLWTDSANYLQKPKVHAFRRFIYFPLGRKTRSRPPTPCRDSINLTSRNCLELFRTIPGAHVRPGAWF